MKYENEDYWNVFEIILDYMRNIKIKEYCSILLIN